MFFYTFFQNTSIIHPQLIGNSDEDTLRRHRLRANASTVKTGAGLPHKTTTGSNNKASNTTAAVSSKRSNYYWTAPSQI
jgi:hypothetical protein